MTGPARWSSTRCWRWSALAITPLLVCVATRYSRVSHPVLTEVQQRLADVTTQAEENVVGVRVVKAFGQEERETARFRERVGATSSTPTSAPTRQRAVYLPLLEFLPTLAVAAVLLIGGRAGGLAAASRSATSSPSPCCSGMLVFPLRMLGMWIGQAQRAVASGARIFALLDERREVDDAPQARAAAATAAARSASRTSSSPTPAGAPCCAAIDLDVPAGTTVALIGPTGCGKTTLAGLVPRFYDVTGGRVLVDGVDVRDLRAGRPAALRRRRLRGHVPVLRLDPREHRLRRAGRDRRARPPRRRARAGAAVHRGAARRLRHAWSASAA